MSNLFSLNWLDVGKACLLFLLSLIVGFLLQSFEAGVFPSWEAILANLKVSAIATGAYLIKNFLTPNTGVPLARDDLSKK
ncbi:hypothetical protein [Flavobacterium sedimenticola]|uniref:Holin n=1 Tax=Flavobacterium sedimenticola TaxID=3043286 RepID=A0ABT6XMK6_9FLAO|nr:hypothetical protein [Flavobacterium sedimenticola]MDI9256314.1 hypothetical protein [Flavobacterium sedimenticola]